MEDGKRIGHLLQGVRCFYPMQQECGQCDSGLPKERLVGKGGKQRKFEKELA